MDAVSRSALEPLTELPSELPLDEPTAIAPAAGARTPPAAPSPPRLAMQAPPSAARTTSAANSTPRGAEPSVAAPAAPSMDRDFIIRNQIVERYLSGRLPIKGATEFERFCRENPSILDELGVPERVNAALRLLEAGGKPEPWQEPRKKLWEKPQLSIGLGAAVLVLAIALVVVARGSAEKNATIAALEKQVAEQPLEPATSTRTIRLLPSRQGSSNSPAVVLGGDNAQLAELKIDVSRSQYRAFRVTIDRIDQGRVGIVHNLMKDSNGHLRLVLNTSALGPGNYEFTIEGLTWRGEPVPDSWVTIGIQR